MQWRIASNCVDTLAKSRRARIISAKIRVVLISTFHAVEIIMIILNADLTAKSYTI